MAFTASVGGVLLSHISSRILPSNSVPLANEFTRWQYSFLASNSLSISITSIFGQGVNASVEVQMRTTVKTLKMKLLPVFLSKN
ncbi:hypothetical protein VCRA2123O444_170096 [Vibrio crassostreae]|nr:hypothetical protein VCRA2119O431_170008 [Vibrio crassostreae]CAK1785805.1 hypothetical protein VCRA2114O422_170008 [Vibrio crassostreae]CAK1797824.1 hypothetical protein VCRA2113O409_170096 [Vibrio crassostreae]CAK1806623.1 hypothetical protein VCRA2113O412_180008 [Vibrio crassostreae]CAK1813403.1 hypothetical protein VCRA2119O430_180097 [Vibrio crassostreae]